MRRRLRRRWPCSGVYDLVDLSGQRGQLGVLAGERGRVGLGVPQGEGYFGRAGKLPERDGTEQARLADR